MLSEAEVVGLRQALLRTMQPILFASKRLQSLLSHALTGSVPRGEGIEAPSGNGSGNLENAHGGDLTLDPQQPAVGDIDGLPDRPDILGADKSNYVV